jgi:hypothetical protein
MAGLRKETLTLPPPFEKGEAKNDVEQSQRSAHVLNVCALSYAHRPSVLTTDVKSIVYGNLSKRGGRR